MCWQVFSGSYYSPALFHRYAQLLSIERGFLGVHFCATSTHETNFFPKLRKSKVIFCATSTHETHFRLFAKVLACSKTRDVNARNAVFLKLSSRASCSSSCFSSPLEPVRNHPSRRIMRMTDRLWGILGVIFCATSTSFWYISENTAR